MGLCDTIVAARKQKGLTQEELADQCNVTVRTIQRIESGETTPRAYTLKAIAAALNISFEQLVAAGTPNNEQLNGQHPVYPLNEDRRHLLNIICLSCFSYIVIPFIHFLVPAYLLKRSKTQDAAVVAFAKKLIRVQIYWEIALCLSLLATLTYNLVRAAYFQRTYLLNFFVPFLLMYFINAVVIAIYLLRVHKRWPASPNKT